MIKGREVRIRGRKIRQGGRSVENQEEWRDRYGKLEARETKFGKGLQEKDKVCVQREIQCSDKI